VRIGFLYPTRSCDLRRRVERTADLWIQFLVDSRRHLSIFDVMRDRYGIKGQNRAATTFASVFGRSARITSARPLTRRLETFRSRGPDTEQRLAIHAVYVQEL
jgi:hypothetical protein